MNRRESNDCRDAKAMKSRCATKKSSPCALHTATAKSTMLTVSADAVAAAAPNTPMFIRHTVSQSPPALIALATITTPKGVTESRAPRHAACRTMAAIDAGAPRIRILEYESAAGKICEGHARRKPEGGKVQQQGLERELDFCRIQTKRLCVTPPSKRCS